MTTQQKNSRADTVRQRRSPQKGSKPAANPNSKGIGTQTSGTRHTNQTTRTARQAYTPASLLMPGEPHPVAPTTLRKMKNGIMSSTASPQGAEASGLPQRAEASVLNKRESKGSAFGMNARANLRGGVVNFPKVPGTSGRVRTDSGMVKNQRRPHTGAKRSAPSEAYLNHKSKLGKDYDSVFSLGRTNVRAPLISLPRLGSRWVSGALTLLLGLMVYTMWTANIFQVSAAEVTGNQRLAASDVTQMLGVVGQPIFTAIPSKIEQNLRTAFPDLQKVSVQVGFPNKILVSVVERMPVLVWYQDNNTTWVDANGIAFTPRGDVQGLVQIAATGDPPPQRATASALDKTVDLQKSLYDQPFLTRDMVQAILTLAPQIPDGAPMIFDPQYGMGWQDSRGWSVYFGQNTQDIPMKLKVYQAILDTFSKQGIQPTLISVAYLDAPFYK